MSMEVSRTLSCDLAEGIDDEFSVPFNTFDEHGLSGISTYEGKGKGRADDAFRAVNISWLGGVSL